MQAPALTPEDDHRPLTSSSHVPPAVAVDDHPRVAVAEDAGVDAIRGTATGRRTSNSRTASTVEGLPAPDRDAGSLVVAEMLRSESTAAGIAGATPALAQAQLSALITQSGCLSLGTHSVLHPESIVEDVYSAGVELLRCTVHEGFRYADGYFECFLGQIFHDLGEVGTGIDLLRRVAEMSYRRSDEKGAAIVPETRIVPYRDATVASAAQHGRGVVTREPEARAAPELGTSRRVTEPETRVVVYEKAAEPETRMVVHRVATASVAARHGHCGGLWASTGPEVKQSWGMFRKMYAEQVRCAEVEAFPVGGFSRALSTPRLRLCLPANPPYLGASPSHSSQRVPSPLPRTMAFLIHRVCCRCLIL